MPEDLNLDPFERTHIGPHGAYVFRVNRAHAKRASEAALARQEAEQIRAIDRQCYDAARSHLHALPLAEVESVVSARGRGR